MIAFLKLIDNKTWKIVVSGWEHPIVTDIARKVSQKPEISWSIAKDETSLDNSLDLNTIFNGVDQNMFKLINTYTSAKETWSILDVAYVGTSKVKMSRLQLLT